MSRVQQKNLASIPLQIPDDRLKSLRIHSVLKWTGCCGRIAINLLRHR